MPLKAARAVRGMRTTCMRDARVKTDGCHLFNPMHVKISFLTPSQPVSNSVRDVPVYALILAMACAVVLCRSAAAQDRGDVDNVTFAEPSSERVHQVKAEDSDTIPGGMGEPARRLLPKAPLGWEGGRVSFTMKIDPGKPNYVTVRLWGSDVGTDRLLLFCEGKQIGYRHLGDIDSLDIGSEAPFCKGRFFYNTSPLPIAMTRGKTEVRLEIRASGPIWTYGRNWDEYQKLMKEPSRGLYRIYTHTDGAFVPSATEKQGTTPSDPPVRTRQARRSWRRFATE